MSRHAPPFFLSCHPMERHAFVIAVLLVPLRTSLMHFSLLPRWWHSCPRWSSLYEQSLQTDQKHTTVGAGGFVISADAYTETGKMDPALTQ